MFWQVNTDLFNTHEPILLQTLPIPGPHSVGVCHFLATDTFRKHQQEGFPRRFMVTAFYPCRAPETADNDALRARFVDILEPVLNEALLFLTEGLAPSTRQELIGEVVSIGLRAYRSATPLRSSAPYPALIYYPAGGCNRFGNVDICEGLASQGYIVLAMDGPHDADLVVFPDGQLSKGPLSGDYISPGVGDVGFLVRNFDLIGQQGTLAGMIDTGRVGIFGHSRGGYIANISAFLYDEIAAAVSIDSFLWGYMTKGTGLERHPAAFQKRVVSTAKPILRLCGRPVGSDPQQEAQFCLKRDGAEFMGDFTVVALPGWQHGEFTTTPWLCGRGTALLENLQKRDTDKASVLLDILTAFFDQQLRAERGKDDALDACIRRQPSLGLAHQPART